MMVFSIKSNVPLQTNLYLTTIVSLGLVFVLSIVVVGLSVLYLSQTEEANSLMAGRMPCIVLYDYNIEHSNQYFEKQLSS